LLEYLLLLWSIGINVDVIDIIFSKSFEYKIYAMGVTRVLYSRGVRIYRSWSPWDQQD